MAFKGPFQPKLFYDFYDSMIICIWFCLALYVCLCVCTHTCIVVSGKEASKENIKGCNPEKSEEEHLL